MNPLFSYSLKSLRRNRTRTIVTVIGIMMSAALITGLATLGSSLYRYVQEGYIYENGDWHLGIRNGSGQDVERITEEIGMENPVYAKSIGYAGLGTEKGGRHYLYLLGVGQGYCEHMPVHLTEGRLPEREGEILLPESFRRTDAWDGLQQSGSLKIGTTMTLEVGLRIKDGMALWQHIPYGARSGSDGSVLMEADGEEVLQELQSRTYTVVGFYESGSSGDSFASYEEPGYEALTWWDGKMADDSYDRYSLWFGIPEVGNNKFHQVYDTLRLTYGYNGSRLSVNLGLLSLNGIRVSDKGESTAMAIAAVILLAIILAGSVTLIYNAFAISVGERTRQFGLLSSIGATKKQIQRSVIYEAILVGGTGTFLGVFAGIGLVAAVLKAAGETVADMMEFSLRPRLYVWPSAVLFAVALALLTVLVSAWLPAKRATRVTAMEAIRQNREIRYSGKQRKVPGFVEGLFGYEGMLAVIYSGRNRKRYRVTVAALFLSMVLFLSINAFCSYMMTSMRTEYKTTNYDVWVQLPAPAQDSPQDSSGDDRRQEIMEILRGMAGVDSVTQPVYLTFRMPLEENEGHVTEDFRGILESYSQRGAPAVAISVVDDLSFSAFCREQGLEEPRFLDTENLTVIVKNGFQAVDEKSGNTWLVEGLAGADGKFYVDLASNNAYEGDYRKNMVEFTVGYYAESLAPGCNDNWRLSVMLPESVAQVLGLQAPVGNPMTFCLTASDHRRAAEEAERLLRAKYPDCAIYDLAERQSANRNLVFLLRLLSNGFIIMITVISMTNVFSTISSGLKLRQKEFAMLKTVGMTQQGLRRMMNLECLMIGGKAVLFGLPVSVLAAAAMYSYFRRDVIFDFYLPVRSVLISIASIFGVVFATMLYTVGWMRKENVIDVLKQENF